MSRALLQAFFSASVFSASVIAVFPLAGVAAEKPGSVEAKAASVALLGCTLLQAASLVSVASAAERV